MRFLSYVRDGFRVAGRHKRLILVVWLAPLVPALVVGALVAANLAPSLDQSLFAERVLAGDWYVVVQEFRSSPADALRPIVTRGVIVMALLTFLLQVVLSAGVVEVLLERTTRHPFVLGIRRNLLRFFRTSVVLAVSAVVLVLAGTAVVRGFFKFAEAKADGRFDILGVVVALLLFLILWAPLDLAADLSRIAAARHGDRSMVKGFFRAWWAVLRRPGTFVPLYLIFLILPLMLHFVYYQLRSPWTPATAAAIVALVVAQQLVMLIRATFKLGFWGAEVAAYRGLDEPQLCRPKERKEAAPKPVVLPESA